MKRVKVTPRDNADECARQSGVFMVERTLATGKLHRSWDESSAYLISKTEVDKIIQTVHQTVEMSRESVDFLLDGEWGTLGTTPIVFDFIRNSFDNRESELFTRYDFAYTQDEELKLVGIEADSPRYFIETAHAQRAWIHDRFATKIKHNKVTQLNSIPEMTISALRKLHQSSQNNTLHLITGSEKRGEDWITTAFLKGLAKDAGWKTHESKIKDIRWDRKTGTWRDEQNVIITNMYKHYPWELLTNSAITRDFANYSDKMDNYLEPAWKYVMDTRAMLPALHHLYPNSSIISPARIDQPYGLGPEFVSAPILHSSSRNEMGRLKGKQFTSWGEDMKDFSTQQTLVHRKLEMPRRYRDTAGGYRFAYLSAFTIGGNIAAIGMRETKLPLLGAHSTFKPHVVML